LLGAGRGTRLAPLTERVPKILAPLDGVPLLEHQLRYLEARGVREVAINVHHLADRVTAFLEHTETSLTIRVSLETHLLGTAGALLPLRDFLCDSFLLLYGDVVTDADLAALLEAHRMRGGIATLAHYESDQTAGKGLLALGPDGVVIGFDEKPASRRSGTVNAGIYALEPEILDFVVEGSDFGRDVFPAVLAARRKVFGYELEDAYLCDVGSPDTLERAERDLVAGAVGW
jgi:NDP-sugar pyrophosphorylase family protein